MAAVAQGFGRFAYGALLPAIRDDLGLSNTVAGFMGTVNVGAYLAGSLAVAAAAGRFRLLPILRIGLVVAAVGLIVTAATPNAVVLAVGMFLSGFGGAMVWIPTPAVAAALAPGRRDTAVALLGSGIGLGVVAAGQLAAYVRSTFGDDAWRTAYVVMGVVAVVVVIATTALIRHDQARPVGGTSQFGGFGSLRRMPGWAPLTAAYTVFGLMYLLAIAFLTTRLEDDSGWPGSRAALAFTLLGLATIAGGPAFVALGRRIGPSRSLVVAFGLWAVLALVVLTGWTVPTLAASAVLGLVFAGIPSSITLYVVANTSTEDYGPAFAAATLCFGVAQMISPQLGGFLGDATGSFLGVFLLSSALAVVGAGFALRVPTIGGRAVRPPAPGA